MNHLSLQFAQNGHFSFRQKIRQELLTIFGHEANAMPSVRGHCDAFNIHIAKVKPLQFSQLAKRKLANPFKWIELLLTLPFELLNWAISRHAIKLIHRTTERESSWTSNLVKGYATIVFYLLAPIINALTHLALSLFKRILAPVRYIIRPCIILAKTQPKALFATIATAVTLGAIISISLITGGIPFILAGVSFAAVLLTKIAISIGSGLAAWCLSLGVANNTIHAIDMVKQFTRSKKSPPQQHSTITSTAHITQQLHHITPSFTRIATPNKQGWKHTLALATGTEMIFFRAGSRGQAAGRRDGEATRRGFKSPSFCVIHYRKTI